MSADFTQEDLMQLSLLVRQESEARRATLREVYEGTLPDGMDMIEIFLQDPRLTELRHLQTRISNARLDWTPDAR